MKDETKDFLKDIGLDFYSRQLNETSKPVSNLKPFFTPHSKRMDDSRTACYTHIKNLIRTYGVDIVTEAVSFSMEDM